MLEIFHKICPGDELFVNIKDAEVYTVWWEWCNSYKQVGWSDMEIDYYSIWMGPKEYLIRLHHGCC